MNTGDPAKDLKEQIEKKPDFGPVNGEPEAPQIVIPKIVVGIEPMRVECRETTPEEVKELQVVEKILGAMKTGWVDAIGLAANQIGIPIRCAVYAPAAFNRPEKRPPVVMINPIITSWKCMRVFNNEGCMSLPYKRVSTWRRDVVEVEYTTLEGERVTRTVRDQEAQVVQHEVDHLNGLLCIDRIHKPEEPGRNELCPCGSGKKYKRCCL